MKHRIWMLAGLCLLWGCARGAAPVRVPTEPPMELSPRIEEEPMVAPTAPPVEAEVALSAAQTDAETEESFAGTCQSVGDRLPFSSDMDGDGEKETLSLAVSVGEDDYPRWQVVLTDGAETYTFLTGVGEDMPFDLYAGDLNQDGQWEVYFCGDLASSDYVIYALGPKLTPFTFEPDERAERWGGSQTNAELNGFIDGFEDDHLVVIGVVDMLGTNWGVRNYCIGDDGIIGPISTVWTYSEEREPLAVTRDLPANAARARKEPGEAFTVPAGEKLTLLCSDGCRYAWFVTDSGKQGVLTLTYDENGQWFIDGRPEEDYFETLPYAG